MHCVKNNIENSWSAKSGGSVKNCRKNSNCTQDSIKNRGSIENSIKNCREDNIFYSD